MATYNIVESKLWKLFIVVVPWLVIHVLYKMYGYIMCFLCLKIFFTRFILILVGTTIIVILAVPYLYSFGYDMSLLYTFVPGCIFLQVVIVSIDVTSICDIIIKRESVCWWIGFPWPPVLIFLSVWYALTMSSV